MDNASTILSNEIGSRLTKELAKYPILSRYDSPEHSEAGALVHALVDMEGSFRRLLTDVFPRVLKKPMTEDDLKDLIWEIRNELQHIVYHIGDVRNFEDLIDRS